MFSEDFLPPICFSLKIFFSVWVSHFHRNTDSIVKMSFPGDSFVSAKVVYFLIIESCTLVFKMPNKRQVRWKVEGLPQPTASCVGHNHCLQLMVSVFLQKQIMIHNGNLCQNVQIEPIHFYICILLYWEGERR